MAKEIYEPRQQSKMGQVVDAAFLLVIVYVALLLPLVLGLTSGVTSETKLPEVTWQTLQQNPTMQAQWEKLGVSIKDAAPMITTRFNYDISPAALITTIVVIVGYFIFVFKTSDREYRDVIREKFD